MTIPVRCFTCGKPLANSKNYYLQQVQSRRFKENKLTENYRRDEVFNVHSDEIKKQIEGIVLDELGLIRTCCRGTVMSFLDD